MEPPASRIVGQTPAVHAAVRWHHYERRPGSRIISPAVIAAPLGAAAVAALEFLRNAKAQLTAKQEVHLSDDRHNPVVQTTHAAVGGFILLAVIVWLVARLFGRGA